jgi:hypothetical protein
MQRMQTGRPAHLQWLKGDFIRRDLRARLEASSETESQATLGVLLAFEAACWLECWKTSQTRQGRQTMEFLCLYICEAQIQHLKTLTFGNAHIRVWCRPLAMIRIRCGSIPGSGGQEFSGTGPSQDR